MVRAILLVEMLFTDREKKHMVIITNTFFAEKNKKQFDYLNTIISMCEYVGGGRKKTNRFTKICRHMIQIYKLFSGFYVRNLKHLVSYYIIQRGCCCFRGVCP